LSAFLSTFNYTLYLLAYLDAKSAPLQAKFFALIGRLTGQPAMGPFVPYAETDSRFRALGALFAQTRVTLRLFGLFPMYAWFRTLMQGPKPGQDMVLYGAQLTQCTLYIAFQFLENVGLLTDNKVLPEAYTARWTASRQGKTSGIFLAAYRCWFAGVLCDLVRLGREAQLKGTSQEVKTADSEEERDAKWWTELAVPFCWSPVAAQFCTDGGVSWFNLGLMGAGGGLAGLARTAALWRATEE